jgi:hypothetical protein
MTAPAAPQPEFLGHTTIGRTAYSVSRLALSEDAKAAGIHARYLLEGPRGSSFLITDLGPQYRLNSVALGGGAPWRCQPRPLRGLERRHLELFATEAAAPAAVQ